MFDYTGNNRIARPHDLIWLDAAGALEGPVPKWAVQALADDAPVVIRRAPRQGDRLPVGVRGASRGERHADWIDASAIRSCRTPESLAAAHVWSGQARRDEIPAIAARADVAAIFKRFGMPWGVTGAVGYELATGQPVAHVESDLDLLVRRPEPLARDEAAALCSVLAAASARCDVQVETPTGAMALAEWASSASRVLVKSDAGPFLSSDPWSAAASDDVARCDAAIPGAG
ncbi:phosphoribosyl-dephospho-CoA transferase [Salinisphaera dokdonensis CL-ES53]|uniref:Phosphoribosyl-dephospho-CoA transferase n=1 Tax=Salinisphaera dokdonensis CL-ES53 TaxID=1304272 RepID=A0ABV2B3Z5_9GAMM